MAFGACAAISVTDAGYNALPGDAQVDGRHALDDGARRTVRIARQFEHARKWIHQETKMKVAETPHDEESRLRALRSLNILDTPAEERFDRLTRLAKRIFDVPIAIISLIDADRQWFKSQIGLDAHEMPREISFCGHTILGNDTFVVNDATKDERFADNPLVTTDPHIRFYAGCPLRHVDGSKLGAFCIVDTVPRTMSDEDLISFNSFAELAEAELVAIHHATRDELTKIMNRNGFITLAQTSLNICIRQQLPATLVFFNLKGFRAVNDQFGQSQGDTALIAFAEQMTKVFRDSDIIARLAGDEFAVLLTDASIEFSEEIIERFRQSLDAYNKAEGRGYEISFRDAMVAVDPTEDCSIRALLIEGDASMYENKRKQMDVPDTP